MATMTERFDLAACDLVKLNSITKYPSIPTYHVMADKGRLTDGLAVTFEPNETVEITEKIDGTNGRIIFTPEGHYVIGSREELLHASGDVIANPALGIVDALKPFAERGLGYNARHLLVVFAEVYGHRHTGKHKCYGGGAVAGVRMFDAFMLRGDDFAATLGWDVSTISGWRDNGGQPFAGELSRELYAMAIGMDRVPLAGTLPGRELPLDLAGGLKFLQQFVPHTAAATSPGGTGEAEGVVIRSADRKRIAKLRYEDYRRSVRRV